MSTYTKDQRKLLRKYSCPIDMVMLFVKLRKEEKISALSDERLLWCIYGTEKPTPTFEECLELAVSYQKVLEEFKDYFPPEQNEGGTLFELSEKYYQHDSFFSKVMDMEVFFYDSGISKEGYGIYYSDFGNVVPSETEEEAKVAVAVFLHMYEHLLRKRVENVKKGIIIVSNFVNFGWSNFDLACQRVASAAFQSFPWKMMKKYVLFNTPWYISMVVRLVQPFYENDIFSRLVTLGPKEELIKGYLDEKNLIEQWGGKKKYDYRSWLEREFGIKSKKEKFMYASSSKGEEEEEEEEEKVVISEEEARENFEKLQKLAHE